MSGRRRRREDRRTVRHGHGPDRGRGPACHGRRARTRSPGAEAPAQAKGPARAVPLRGNEQGWKGGNRQIPREAPGSRPVRAG
ncbi:hypothetical protein STXM2123_1921 [Streptomyces sp. F-3]|nr:hypothetical protein STXM2123_1921 [Streptomyces sp. F-3]